MNGPHPSELLETVEKRGPMLRCLAEGVDDKRDIESELGVSRSTVNRAFCELEGMGMLRTEGGNFDLTLHGKLVHRQYERLTDAYEHLSAATELSSYLPADARIDMRLFEDAEVSLSDKQTPQKPFEAIKRAVRSAESVRGCLPVVLPSYVDLLSEQVRDSNVAVELVFEDTLIPTLSTTYADKFAPVAESDNCHLWQTEEELPFGLIVVDDEEVWLCVYRDGGGLRGTLANDTDAAVSWADGVLEQYRSDAQEVRFGERRARPA